MPPLDGSGALSLLFKGYSARRVAKVMGASNVAVLNLLAKFIEEAKECKSVGW